MSDTLNKSYVSVGEPLLPKGKMFFTIQPHNFTISGPGQEVTFRGVAVGAAAYLWAWRPDPSAEWAVIEGEETDTFTTLVSAGMDGWQFICVAVDAEDNYLESRVATISITGTEEITLSGEIVTIEQGPVNIKSLIVGIDCVQEGTGDPSSENVRPISGHTQCDVVRCGVNLFDKNASARIINGYFDTGAITSNDGRRIAYIPCDPNTKYTVQKVRQLDNDRFSVAWSENVPAVGTAISGVVSASNSGTVGTKTTLTITTGATAKYLCVWFSWNTTVLSDELDTLMIEEGSTASSYVPYNGQTYTLPFGTTVYGGYLDVTNGKLYSCPYYASYDGEELTGHWISDRDVYAEGTTPTTGAQVVNDGGALTETELEPVEITTIMGQNNIYASTGSIEIEYLDWPAAPEDELLLNPQIILLSPLDIEPVLEPAVDDIQPIADDLQPMEFDNLL